MSWLSIDTMSSMRRSLCERTKLVNQITGGEQSGYDVSAHVAGRSSNKTHVFSRCLGSMVGSSHDFLSDLILQVKVNLKSRGKRDNFWICSISLRLARLRGVAAWLHPPCASMRNGGCFGQCAPAQAIVGIRGRRSQR